MVSDPSRSARDRALRELLVETAYASRGPHPTITRAERAWWSGWSETDRRAFVATAAVVVLVLAATIAALGLVPALRSARPAELGPVPIRPTQVVQPRPEQPTVEERALGVWTSDDPAPVRARVRTYGLVLKIEVTCTGDGSVMVGMLADGPTTTPCSTKNFSGGGIQLAIDPAPDPSYLTVTPSGTVRWRVAVSGRRSTYVTPGPVLVARTGDGAVVPFCAARSLAVSYAVRGESTARPKVRRGQLTFTNTGSATCALAGYPGLRYVVGGRTVEGSTERLPDVRASLADGLRPVILPPRGHAYVQTMTAPAAKIVLPCRPATTTTLRINLANPLAGAAQTGSVDARVAPVGACTNPDVPQLWGSVFVDYGLPPLG